MKPYLFAIGDRSHINLIMTDNTEEEYQWQYHSASNFLSFPSHLSKTTKLVVFGQNLHENIRAQSFLQRYRCRGKLNFKIDYGSSGK